MICFYRFTEKFVKLFLAIILCGGIAFGQPLKKAYVVNSIGESLSEIDLNAQTVNANAATLGLFTNMVQVRDSSAYVINSGVNEVQIIDLATLSTTGQIDVGSGTNPWAIEFIDDQLAAVSLLFTNQVVFVDVVSGQIQQTADVGTGPEGMVFSDGVLYVANSGFNGAGFDPGTVSAINISDFSVTNIAVGTNPQALALDVSGNIIVACSGSFFDANVNGEVDVIDKMTQTVTDSVTFDPSVTNVIVNSENKAYLATFGAGVLVYNLDTQTFERGENDPLPGGPGMAIDQLGNVYITDFGTDSLFVFSPTHQRIGSYLVGDGPVSVAIYDEGIINGVETPRGEFARSFTLRQNYPNPFNPETTISFDAIKGARFRLDVLDVTGRVVTTLINDFLPAGQRQVAWNGKNQNGEAAATGIYYYRLTAEKISQVKKMTLLR